MCIRDRYEEAAFEYYLFLGHHGELSMAYDARGMPLDDRQGG